jgi:hypothetical protein
MTSGTRKTLWIIGVLVVLGLALPVSNVVVGMPSGTMPTRATPAAGADVPAFDAAAQARRLAELKRSGFPLMDLHIHLKGGLTLEQALAKARESGMRFGIAVNGGLGFPVQDDAGALAFVESMEGQPVFLALQGEGREWVTLFSKETRARFDYVFTDAMTFSDARGRRTRLWMKDEVEVGEPQAFMDTLVGKIVGVLENEPIDVYVNPTFLPEAIAAGYERLWTDERMQRVIDAAVRNGVAIEINARYRIPSERFIRRAKQAGAKFTFGTNNTGPEDLGDWSYCLDMQRRCRLTAADMFVPGRKPRRASRP